jgi:hypothetical protein
MTTIAALQARIDALAPFTRMGSGYVRGVVDGLVSASRFVDKGELDSAEGWVMQAECAAGLITTQQLRDWYDARSRAARAA